MATIKYAGGASKAKPRAPAKQPPPTTKTTLPKGTPPPPTGNLAYRGGAALATGAAGLGKSLVAAGGSALDAIKRGMLGMQPAGRANLAYGAGLGANVIGSMAAKPFQLGANTLLGFLNQGMIPGSTAELGRSLGAAGRHAVAQASNLALMPFRPGNDFMRGVLAAAGLPSYQLPTFRPTPQNQGFINLPGQKPWSPPAYTGPAPADRLIDAMGWPYLKGLGLGRSLDDLRPKFRSKLSEEPVDYLPPPPEGGDGGYGYGGGGGWNEYAAGRSNAKQYGDQFYEDLTRWINV